jgi:hypothetical protein
MIHELRIYDIAPGALARYIELAETQVPRARGDRFGRLVGFWRAASGSRDRVFHVWEYESLDDRQAGRDALFRERPWLDDFIAHVWPIIVEQRVVFLAPRGTITKPAAGTSHLYELRTTHARTGHPGALADALAGHPAGAGEARVACWTGIAPWPNSVVELFAHPAAAPQVAQVETLVPVPAADGGAALSRSAHAEWLVPIAISPLC